MLMNYIIILAGVSISFAPTDGIIMEVNRRMEVCIILINGTLSDRDIEFTLSMLEESAMADEDFIREDFQLSLAPSLNEVCVEISVMIDDIVEDTETFTILLQTNDRSVNIEIESQMITIVDSSMVNLKFIQGEYSVREGENINVCIVLIGLISRTVDASIQAVNGSKFLSCELMHASLNVCLLCPAAVLRSFQDTISFSPSDNSTMCLSISPIDNNAVELTQFVTLVLVSDDHGVNTTLDASTLIVTADDDSKSPPIINYYIILLHFQVLFQDLTEKYIVCLKMNLLYTFVSTWKEL